jgi:hypothetical protein
VAFVRTSGIRTVPEASELFGKRSGSQNVARNKEERRLPEVHFGDSEQLPQLPYRWILLVRCRRRHREQLGEVGQVRPMSGVETPLPPFRRATSAPVPWRRAQESGLLLLRPSLGGRRKDEGVSSPGLWPGPVADSRHRANLPYLAQPFPVELRAFLNNSFRSKNNKK